MKVRDEGFVRNKAVRIALGVWADGIKEILSLWLEQNESAKFWLRAMTKRVKTNIVHLLRHSLDFTAYKDREPVATALKDIYRVTDAAAPRRLLLPSRRAN